MTSAPLVSQIVTQSVPRVASCLLPGCSSPASIAPPLPARGLCYSVLAHVLFGVVILYLPWSYWLPPAPHFAPHSCGAPGAVASRAPPWGGASAFQLSSRGRGKSKVEAPATSSEAKALQGGLPGPQLIISNSPHPDNFVQTIRQPDIGLRNFQLHFHCLPWFPSRKPTRSRLSCARRGYREPPGFGNTCPAHTACRSNSPRSKLPGWRFPSCTAEALRTVANSAPPASMPFWRIKLSLRFPERMRTTS